MKRSNHASVVRLTSLALLAALVVVLQTVASGIRIGPVPISLTLVPIVVGAILFGPGAGAGLGAVFGIVCLIAGITGADQFTNVLWVASPFWLVVVCVGKAVLCGLCAGLVAKALRQRQMLSCILAALTAPFVNTGVFVSSLILSIFWTGNMIVIYLLHALVYCLYMVWQLYHSEFFTFSLVTASAGVVFYLIARTSYMANRIVGSILLALILIGTALTVFLCAKNRGKLNLGSRMLRLFPDGFNPLLFYFICVLWAVVLAACLLFGSGFAFYAMFAAIAVELIGAVYYTFQLK